MSQHLPSQEQPNKRLDDDLIAGGKVMTIFDHLAELRGCIIKSLIAVILGFLVCFTYADRIMNFLKQPLLAALPDQAKNLHFTGPLDVFFVNVKVAFLSSIILACPVWFYQFWKFFEPALYPRERKYILPFSIMSMVLFLTGVLFCFYVVVPYSMDFLISIGIEVGIPMITIIDYVSLLMILIFSFGIVFETPLILVLLAFLDIIDADTLAKNRRIVIIVILIIAAILTPPDPISQISLAIPIYVMYEMAILIIRAFVKDHALKEDDTSHETPGENHT